MNCLQGASEHNVQVDLSEPQKKKQPSSVTLRWLTAVVAIPIVLVFVWFGGWAAFAATVLVVVIATLELHTMLLNAGYRPLLWISLGLSILFLVAAMLPQQRLLILEIGLGASLLLSFPSFFFRRKLEGALVDWALTLVISLYIGWPISLLLLLRKWEPGVLFPASGGWLFLPSGIWWLLATLLSVWSFDGGAFFAGRYLGRHKLAPHISPAKTWEGVFGGLIVCIVSCLIIVVIPLGVPWYLALVLALLISCAATLGDLAESLIKRQTHVKDSGQIMPGHGGMLDRMDSVLFVAVVVYIFAQLLGK